MFRYQAVSRSPYQQGEQLLEEYLQNHLDQIETGLQLIGRQHSTKVGPIDLFANAANGDMVVVELKKGRAADKVFGQICRYMGCIKSELSSSDHAVRGYIVGREVDVKLQYAVKVVATVVIRLQTFTVQDKDEGEGDGKAHWIHVVDA